MAVAQRPANKQPESAGAAPRRKKRLKKMPLDIGIHRCSVAPHAQVGSATPIGGGRYLQSMVRMPHMAQGIVEQINQMEKRELEAERFVQYEERYQIPLALSLICFIALMLLPEKRKTSGTWKGRFT